MMGGKLEVHNMKEFYGAPRTAYQRHYKSRKTSRFPPSLKRFIDPTLREAIGEQQEKFLLRLCSGGASAAAWEGKHLRRRSALWTAGDKRAGFSSLPAKHVVKCLTFSEQSLTGEFVYSLNNNNNGITFNLLYSPGVKRRFVLKSGEMKQKRRMDGLMLREREREREGITQRCRKSSSRQSEPTQLPAQKTRLASSPSTLLRL
ncbi:uncharacterized protein LOC122845588 [Gambusia affinis]|uniref:uncharacterized protein LOC122845588 n=1 Tax=Gambusia affinis TaxID=33528 RepID=UPI001CDB675F|nr:uncharacterized protein LOC122845588 [Gambusia affinis]